MDPANLSLIDVIDYADPTAKGLQEPTQAFDSVRMAIRAVVRDESGLVYCLKVAADGGYLKLPGGGVENGETYTEALGREIREELGRDATPGPGIGRIVQFDSVASFRQDSSCYFASVTSSGRRPDFTEEEIADGFELVTYTDLAAAIRAFEDLAPSPGESSSIVRRDLSFLRLARSLDTYGR